MKRLAIRRELLRRSFLAFVRAFWGVVEPTRALMPSVAVDGICAVLQEAAERGGRWAISCPPGVSKSLLAAVLYPAWLILRSAGQARVMLGSYAHDLAARDSIRCRALVESPEYRELVAGKWTLRDDANTIGDWHTTASGRRLIASVSGKATGERVGPPGAQIIDDALSAQDAYSEAKRREAARWVTTVMPSRLDDPEHATRVLIGQRLAVNDPIGVVLEQGGWQYLRLPALADDHPCELLRADGSLIWRDPRAPGEPLFALLGVDALARLKVELGSASFASQYQQSPHDEEAAMFKRAWLTRRWTELPAQRGRAVITLDATFKESKSSDYAVIQCWIASGADRYLVEQWRRQAGFADTLAALKAMAARYPFAKVLIESAANGHAIYEQLRREIPGVLEVKPEGGKTARAASVQAIIESGAVVLPANAPWVDAWIDEVTGFPGGSKNDDCVDAMVYALRSLQGPAFVQSFGGCGSVLFGLNGPGSISSGRGSMGTNGGSRIFGSSHSNAFAPDYDND